MTPEMLELYKVLQPLFEEKMGTGKVGDKLWGGVVIKVADDTLTILLDDGSEYNILIANANKELVRLPLTIDPVNPGRGCWGMLDWEQWDMSSKGNGNVSLYNMDYPNPDILNMPATEAILLALCAQEGL